MMECAPHTLMKETVSKPQYDQYGRQVSEGEKTWMEVCKCFCHDNSQMKQVAVNGELWTYSYHVVYEGAKIPLNTHVKCVDSEGNVIGEGNVKKNAECYSDELKGMCDIWL
ncbi:MAG: hypothetical protein LKF81_10190 [Prevotella sp.]|nr:hypothetical protein [Prevotella sp.]